MIPNNPHSPEARRGIALIVVLWVTALVSVLAMGFSYTLRSEAQLNAAVLARAQAAAAAEAGVQRILAMLKAAPSGSSRNAPLQNYNLTFDGLSVRVDIVSESGKIDLNAAPPAHIQGLLQRAAIVISSLDSDRAGALADAILDWRDTDSRSRGQGAERRDYIALGLAGPRDQPFLSVSEIRQVLGMSREVYAFLSPRVSVDSQSSRIDPRAAARDTLLAVPGLDELQVDQYLAGRDQGEEQGARLAPLLRNKGLQVPGRTRTYSITAVASTQGGVRALRRVVVRLNRSSVVPIVILGWSRFQPGYGQVNGVDEAVKSAGDV